MTLGVQLADGPVLRVGERAAAGHGLGGRVPRRVLAVLALSPGAVPRDVLAEHVWDGDPPASWETALRGAIHRLRRVAADLGGEDPIHTAFGCYELDRSASVDLIDAAAAVPASEAHLREGNAAAAAAAAKSASRVLGRTLLPGLEGRWFDDRRREAADLGLRAALVHSQAATALGEHRTAIVTAQAAVDAAPLLEAAHQRLMAAHAAAGDRAAALVAYERCRQLLVEELGVDPSDRTEEDYLELLGVETPVPIAPRTLPASLTRTLSLVGREREVDDADAVLRQAIAGESAGLLLVGAAGVGKSRFAAEMGARAVAAGAAVVHGRFAPDALLSLGAVSEALGQLGVAWPAPGRAGGIGASSDEVRGSLVATAVATISAVTASQPLVIVLDDLHWADRATCDLLRQVLLDPNVGRLLVVATCRGDVGHPTVTELAAGLGTRATSLPIEPLDAHGTAALLRAWAGHDASAELADWLHSRSEGNPLFCLALLDDLGSSRGIDLREGLARATPPDDHLPGRVQDLVLRTASALAGPTRDLLDVAAVDGPTIDVDLLAGATGSTPAVVLSHLEVAGRQGLVGQSPTDTRSWAFTHHLVVEALVEHLGPRAKAIHAALAEAVAGQPEHDPSALAHHLVSVGEPAALLAAVDPTAEATGRAWRRGAVEAAIARSSHLDDLLLGAGADVDGNELARRLAAGRARVQVALGAAEMSRNALADGRAHLQAAARLADTLEDPSLLLGIAGAWRIPEIGSFDADLVAVIDRLAALAAPASVERALLRCWSAAERAWVVDGALDAASDAVEVARDSCDPWLLREAINTWHLVGRSGTDPQVRHDRMLEAVRLERRAVDRAPALTSLLYLAGDCIELGDLAEARETLALVRTQAGDGVPTVTGWLADRLDAVLSTATGDWADAEAGLARVDATGASLANPEAPIVGAAMRISMAWHRGGLAPMQGIVGQLARADESASGAMARATLATIHAEVGGDAEALDDVTRAIEAVLHLPLDVSYWGRLALTVQGAAALRHPRAQELRPLLLRRRGRHVLVSGFLYLGAVDRLLGLLAAAADELDEAVALLHAAYDQHRTAGAAPHAARTAAELAGVLRRRARRGDTALADGLAGDAATIATDLGLPGVVRLLRQP